MAEENQAHQEMTNKLTMNMIGMGLKDKFHTLKDKKAQQLLNQTIPANAANQSFAYNNPQAYATQ